MNPHNISVQVIEGELHIEKLVLARDGAEHTFDWSVTVRRNHNAIKAI